MHGNDISDIRMALSRLNPSTKGRIVEKFFLAALGSIPWVGGFLSTAASLKTEEGGIKTNILQSRWLEEHQIRLEQLQVTLATIHQRFESLGDEIDERLQSESYLGLVRKSFRAWDQADTHEKRTYIANLITNAVSTKLSSDDLIRLFIDWLELYHESHFAVIREIYKHQRLTRAEIWESIHGSFPREDSAEADLFKFLIRDLSTGGIIRQEREIAHDGSFIKKPSSGKRSPSPSRTMESAFEDSKAYNLTELGKQFVHYTMNEVVIRLE